MRSTRIRRLVDAAPFRPDKIHLADDQFVPVHHRESTVISLAAIDFVVYPPDRRIEIMATSLQGGFGLETIKREPSSEE